MDDPVWDVTVFPKNRDRLLDGEIAAAAWNRSRNAGGRRPVAAYSMRS